MKVKQQPLMAPADYADMTGSMGRSSGAVRLLVWGVCALLAGIQAFAMRFSVNADGISYLSLSDEFLKGDWGAAVNGYWSPGYPLLLAAIRRLIPATSYWEAPLAHFLNVLLFLSSFGLFRIFLNEVRRSQRRRIDEIGDEGYAATLTAPAESLAAYAVFLWGGLVLIGVAFVTPDLMIACLVFGIAALTLRLRSSGAKPASYAMVGTLAALGFLTKTVMFPLGFLVVVTSAVGTGSFRAWGTRTLAAAAGFLVVATPQIIAQSNLVGRLSYGETGTVAYAQYVNGIPQWWTGLPPGSGVPRHPVRRIHEDPSAYEFAVPVEGFSYPYRDQPAHWAEGMQPRFDLKRQLDVTIPIVEMYALMLLPLLAAAALIAMFGHPRRWSWDYLPIILPGVGAYGLYALVYSEARYLGAWTVVLFVGLLASPTYSLRRKSALHWILVAVAAIHVAIVGLYTAGFARHAIERGSERSPHTHFEIASSLRRKGVVPGQRVASVGYAYNSYWARLARVQIAMEVPDARGYWAASDSVRRAVDKKFSALGAVAIISDRAPSRSTGGWERLAHSDYYFRSLR